MGRIKWFEVELARKATVMIGQHTQPKQQAQFFCEPCETCGTAPRYQRPIGHCLCGKNLCEACEQTGQAFHCLECQALLSAECRHRCQWCKESFCLNHLNSEGLCSECAQIVVPCPHCGEWTEEVIDAEDRDDSVGYHCTEQMCAKCAPRRR